MTPAPKNPRRSALLAVLLIVAAVIVWRLGRPSPPSEAKPAIAPPPANTAANPASAARASASKSDASEQWHGPVKRTGVNAANLYADAFVLLGRLTEDERKLIRNASEEVDADQAAQLYEKLQAIMALLRDAAKADYCDWGLGVMTPETSLAHLGNAQVLGQLALWAAAYRFPTDPLGAIDDLGVRAKIGHHLSDTAIGMLIAMNLESGANNLLRDRMRSLDANSRQAALDFVARSTLDADISRATDGEVAVGDAWLQRFERMNPRERGKEILMLDESDPNSPAILDDVKQVATGLLYTPARMAEVIQLLRGIQAGAADAMRMSEEDFQRWRNAAKAQLAGTVVGELVLNHYENVQPQMQKLRVERMLLTAAADILQHGPAQVGRYRDPATGGALQYLPTPSGFELRSPYVAKGKPVTMEFRR